MYETDHISIILFSITYINYSFHYKYHAVDWVSLTIYIPKSIHLVVMLLCILTAIHLG